MGRADRAGRERHSRRLISRLRRAAGAASLTPPAALVLSVLALLLAAAAPPAYAQSEVILIGNFTVERYQDTHAGGVYFGYEGVVSPPFGALSATHFRHQSVSREITALYLFDSKTWITFSPALTSGEVSRFESTLGLVVGGQTYDFADSSTGGGEHFAWPGRPLGWTDGARVIVKLVHKPAAPGGLTATPSYDEGYPTVALAWDDPADPMVGGYQLRMKKGTGAWGEWQEIQLRDIEKSGNRWSYPDAGRRWPGAQNAPESLDPGADYTFEVRARNEGGTGPAAQQSATTLGDATAGEHGDLHISRSSDTLHEGGAITYTLSRPSANAPATIGFYLSYPYPFKGLISSNDFRAPAGQSGHECDDDANDYDCLTIVTVTLPASGAVSPQRPQTRQLRIQYKSSGNYVARAVPGGGRGVGVQFQTFNSAHGFTEYYKTRISGLGTSFPFTIEPDNPGAPAGLSATAGAGEVTLAWDRLPQKHRDRDTIYEYRVTPPSDAEWAEIPGSSSVTDGYTVTGLTGGTSYVFEVRVAQTGNSWKGPSSEVRETPSGSPVGMRSTAEFGATFHDLPAAHDGETPFTFELRFSEDVEGLSYKTLRDDAFEVAGGRVRGARRLVRGSNQRWEISVAPDGRGDVAVTLPGERACGAVGAVCTAGGRRLSNSPSATVPGPAPVRLTAEFHDLPFEHDGETPFTFELRFSEDVEGLSYKTLRDDAFTVTNGRVSGARRLVRGSNERWQITVVPDAAGDIVIELPPASDCAAAGAVCTADGRPLAFGLLAQVLGPAALTVADAEATEETDATLAFAVSLSRAASGPVTVDYATADGTAAAGADYTATSGTLTFAPGETAKTVNVPVLDDAHDEGEETLALVLSNASGARIHDGEATGTIKNSDAIPQAWLARFGRTVTGHVLDAVEARLKAPRTPGIETSLAGQALTPGSGSGAGGQAAAAGEPRSGAAPAADAEDRGAMAALGTWLAQAGPDGRDASRNGGSATGREAGSRVLTGRDFITGTSFALTAGSTGDGGSASVWGRGAISGFDGREGGLSLDGEVTTGLIGADWASAPGSGSGAGRWTAGLAVGHSRGTGGYRSEAGDGEIDATLTGVYPYAGLTLVDRLSVWTAAGYGSGEGTVTPEGQEALTADLTMRMGAAGIRNEVLTPEEDGGLSLAVKGDGRFTRTSSGSASGGSGGRLEASDADVWLLRTGVEGSRRFALGGADGATLTPSFELGLRLDGGDAETGFGADLGGGLAFTDPRHGLSLQFRARGLLAHESSGFREWGASAGLAWDPRPDTDRGLLLSLRQGWGVSPTGGMDALLGRETLAGLAANDDAGPGPGFKASSRLEAGIGFGIAMFGGAFTGTPHAGFGLSETGRDYRLGWRLTSAVPGDPGFEVGLEAARGENDNAPAEHGLMLRGTIRW